MPLLLTGSHTNTGISKMDLRPDVSLLIDPGIVPSTSYLGLCLHRKKIYPLSMTESVAMETYITEALNQGFICPSSSSDSVSFFFVLKKDGRLWHCSNYCGLNAVMMKFKYTLLLVPFMLEQLHGAWYFT